MSTTEAKLRSALARLLACPDLNVDTLEQETREAIIEADAALTGGNVQRELEQRVREAWQELARASGFEAVPISKVARAMGAEVGTFRQFVITLHKAGRVVLSVGDWSIAGPAERAAVINKHGQKYLQMRFVK